MAGDEIRHEFAFAAAAADDVVEFDAQTFEEFERRFRHEFEDGVFGMFRRYFETAGCMFEDELAKIWI